MKFLKITNRPLDFAIPKKNGQPDWDLIDIKPEKMHSYLIQEHISMEDDSNYVSLLPIEDENNVYLLALINETNNNENPNDIAEIIDISTYNKDKTDLLKVKADKKIQAKEDGL